MKLTRKYETKLETSNIENIGAVLDAKLEATSPEQLTDYVAFGIDNLEATIQRMKDAETELKVMRAEIENQIEVIKIGTSKWLSDTGITNLHGDIVSSMKVTQPKEKTELVITTDEDSLINQGYFKTVLDKTAIKNSILDGTEIDGAELKVTHQQESLTIYKKRSHAIKLS